MSYSVSAATLTAVNASISTPVRSAVRTVAVIGDFSARTDVEVDVDTGQRQLVAQRNQVLGALGGQDASHPGGRQCVTLG